ncbi:hypothetical protein D1007_43000 [Hordeum vulgare]|uniref:Predicted protein n=1 Tax=Hordeum vulgare subsp. vulgare TaxID=112509 RepID=F2CU58_HORVV|nr:uncharacterized protein LOC123400195 [Hordeum vulgare subsp. vulgare]KAE8783483.1 hypothetical protein D1007_43000 [Hordeum vulgare]KAI4989386.1 hypothetical protein ZWY2020_036703 [Hordeum vulgare]BAJ86379.1 predicted protein [Hordeum vulgare subsp. vulgare]
MAFTARMKDLMRKYGKVALGVHVSVSVASVSGLYVAINNNVDVDAIFRKIGISAPGTAAGDAAPPAPAPVPAPGAGDGALPLPAPAVVVGQEAPRNRTGELAASSGGALALAVLCNKALFPVRVPITIALTPPIARLLARWKLVKSLKQT